MASTGFDSLYTRSERNTKHVSYTIPFNSDGVSHRIMAETLSTAYREYSEASKSFVGALTADEAIHIVPSKDGFLVYFTLEEHK